VINSAILSAGDNGRYRISLKADIFSLGKILETMLAALPAHNTTTRYLLYSLAAHGVLQLSVVRHMSKS
jgi:hypothetical protein